jgi:hypothetical protein
MHCVDSLQKMVLEGKMNIGRQNTSVVYVAIISSQVTMCIHHYQTNQLAAVSEKECCNISDLCL